MDSFEIRFLSLHRVLVQNSKGFESAKHAWSLRKLRSLEKPEQAPKTSLEALRILDDFRDAVDEENRTHSTSVFSIARVALLRIPLKSIDVTKSGNPPARASGASKATM